jgi:hypothetical protein
VNVGSDPSLENSPGDPDDLGYNVPQRPSQLAGLSDRDLFRLLQKVAFANNWPFDSKVQFEATGRLIAALTDFKKSSDRAATVLIILTLALVALTGVLVWLTTRLA